MRVAEQFGLRKADLNALLKNDIYCKKNQNVFSRSPLKTQKLDLPFAPKNYFRDLKGGDYYVR